MLEPAIADNVRNLRKTRGMTLDGLAGAAGVSKSYLSDLENDRMTRPSADKLAKIAFALGVTLEFLMGNEHLYTAENKAFIAAYHRMHSETQEQLRGIARVLDPNAFRSWS